MGVRRGTGTSGLQSFTFTDLFSASLALLHDGNLQNFRLFFAIPALTLIYTQYITLKIVTLSPEKSETAAAQPDGAATI
jgi:hypothetical protein